MTRKVLCLVIALMMAISAVALADVPAFEDIVFPDALPAGMYLADELGLDYSYDDLTEKYEVEFLITNYGNARPEPAGDPMVQWMNKQFNVDMTITQVLSSDLSNLVSTRFAGGDEAEVTVMPDQATGFNLNAAGLLIDARKIYPYMPLNCKYVTNSMLAYSTNENGELAFVTGYGLQDGVWGLVIRQDWLDTLQMEVPTTKEALIEYAKAVTFNDPDGNGVDDTYFMTGAGGGTSFGMLEEFNGMYGYAGSTVDENGVLSHHYLNGVRKGYLEFLHELYELEVLAPDWYTIEWETAKSYTLNNKIGMVRYPASNIYGEYISAHGEKDITVVDNWTVLEEYPIEGGKYQAAGNPGALWGFSTNAIDSDGKLMRIAHMVDSMRAGGANWQQTIQRGNDDIYTNMGVELVSHLTNVLVPNGDGTYMYYVKYDNKDADGNTQFPYCENDQFYGLDPLQTFGLNTCWNISDPEPENEYDKEYNAIVNKGAVAIAGYDRWPNYGLAVVLTGEAAENQALLKDWVANAELEFVTGARSFEDWDSYVEEWIDKGGEAILEQTAECLGCEMPEI